MSDLRLYLPILIAFIALLLLSCGRANCPRYFYIPALLSPTKVEYKLGDTISVTSSFHKNLIGYTNEHEDLGYFDLEGIKFNPVTFIYPMDDSLAGHSVVSEAFDLIEDENYNYGEEFYSEGAGLIGEYNFHNDTFDLRYSFVVRKPGLYYHEFGTWLSFSDQKFPGKCLGAWSVYVELNMGINNNLELLSQSPHWHYNTWIPQDAKSRFYDMGGFAFRVVE